ncbi:hypothetical protein [Pyrobaculum aerophilum]|jgi:hypothetical protein|uniref:Uncharacterized protein n=2 Tax=Pyrobaculum aerophilum TaxID=13773 RepID=Q8ZWM0_PYRAE|nr:hypothetical protein [Pyrobaculum aerophilum]AAL63681.1 hypothetical protein PAE1720 [Pyrobaculum aerophilum str. IM2]MCX8137145.1 hypothetical protein [Pyrobaculum aerophilum]HII46750.1 hypothetical protein [Pyrobaculum aerophilum]
MERKIVLGLALAAEAVLMFSATYPDQKFRPLVARVQYEARWGFFFRSADTINKALGVVGWK